MKYNELTASKRKSTSRKGRGIAAGRGKTAGRGTKGQNSRTGGGTRPGFEGGQNPLYQRIPKFPGFKSHRAPKQEVRTEDLNVLAATGKVTNNSLFGAGLIADEYKPVKLIAGEEIKKAYKVELSAASAGAIKLLEKAGGSFTQVETPKRSKKASK